MGIITRDWFGRHVVNIVSPTALSALAAKWLQLKSEREPVLADFWNSPSSEFCDHSVLVMKDEDGDYTYLHQGRSLYEQVGFSIQGRKLSELRTNSRAALKNVFDQCVESFDIGYTHIVMDFSHDTMLWGILCLPLRLHPNDGRMALLGVCHLLRDKASVFQSVYDATKDPMIVAYPIFDQRRRIEDAWIIGQNEAAAAVTGGRVPACDRLRLRSGPIFADERLWRFFAERLPLGPTSARARLPSSGIEYLLRAELTGDVIVFHFSAAVETEAVFEIAPAEHSPA